MVPVRAGVAQREVVREFAAGRNRLLCGARCAIHVVRYTQPVPMDRRLLRQRVLEVHDHAVANLAADQRPRDLAVVCPHGGLVAGQDFELGYLGLEVEFEHVRVEVQVVGLRQREVVGPTRRLPDFVRGLLHGRRLRRSGRPRAGAQQQRATR